jgi:thiol-disulfide isomerase/thioredoxin
MRYMYFLLLLSFIACASGTIENKKEEPVTEVYMSVEDKKKATEPVMGGPADFTVRLVNYTQGGTARLIGFYFDQNFVIDTVSIKGEIVQFVKAEGYPQGLYYVAMPNNQFIQVVLGENQKFTMEVNPANVSSTMIVKGSPENEAFYETMRFEEKVNPKLNAVAQKMQTMDQTSAEFEQAKKERLALEAERKTYLDNLAKKHPNLLFTKFKIGGQNPTIRENVSQEEQVYFYRKEFWDNVDFSDRRLLRTPMVGNKVKRYFKDITAQTPDSIFSSAKLLVDKLINQPEYYKVIVNWVVLEYEPTKCSLMDPESVFVNMVNNYFTYERAFWSDSIQTSAILKRAYEMGQSLIGQKAQNIISTDDKSQRQELYKKTADYLIVYMYNPECEHCMIETPKLHAYYLKNKAEVDVFAVAVDTDDQKWKNYIKKQNLTWTNVYDPTNRSIYAKYWVDITPEIYVLNKDRIIIGKNLKSDQVQVVIDRDKEKRSK